MMDTPICDFVRDYIDRRALRLHMPGHKGTPLLGFEEYDITEITGADSLYEADGIIKRSEDNASLLFGCPTFYSAEGSSQCIRAMLYLAVLCSGEARPTIAAGRNAHKTFVNAAAMLDLDIDWLCGDDGTYLSCTITPDQLDDYLSHAPKKPAAVYVTSPDYLGNMLDVGGIADTCHRHGVMLLVDSAHGAYLRFLPESLHPCDLGADMCCSSAHKTLPVLTGGAYLHISPAASPMLHRRAKSALAMFGSTSPSYLILESLDRANVYLEGHRERLAEFLPMANGLKAELADYGFVLMGDEPLKLTLCPKSYGYSGYEMAEILEALGLVPEFADPDHLVMMLTPELSEDGLCRIKTELCNIPRRASLTDLPPRTCLPPRRMSVREAAFAMNETVRVEDSLGRVLAAAEIGCPPAVPIIVCGEEITMSVIECLKYYDTKKCTVVL